MKKMGFGVIGLGAIADVHVKAINSIPDACFVAGFDMVPGRADAFCKERGGKGYDNIDAFLSDSNLETVTITTPSGAHLDVALASMRAGKNVIIEKPLEITTERCDQLIAEAKKCGVTLSGIFQSRFHEAPQLVKKALEEGRFGTISIIDAQVKWFRTQEYYDAVKWHGTWKLDGGGALMNQSIHAIDLLQWFGGEVKEITGYTATLAHERIEVEDTAVANLKFASGALGVIEGTTAAYPGFLKRIEICGSRGCAVIEEESLKCWHFVDDTEEDEEIRKKYFDATQTGGGAGDPHALGFHGHARVFEDVLHAVREGREPAITGEEARKSVAIIEAIYESAREHKATVPR
jgi:Predicted dehydrogenases and related proteins